MGLFRPNAEPFLVERRAARRWRATCAATLETITGERQAQLWDISETGARLRLESPPPQGTDAFLRWADQKISCYVVWANHDMCGLAFGRPIDPSLVLSTSRLIGDVEMPVATISNIRSGRKRSDRHTDPGSISHSLQVSSSTFVISLQRRRQVFGPAAFCSISAAEEMFFFGSPLAHVLAYEKYLQS